MVVVSWCAGRLREGLERREGLVREPNSFVVVEGACGSRARVLACLELEGKTKLAGGDKDRSRIQWAGGKWGS